MRAWLNLRYTVPERRAVYVEGLKRIGYSVCDGITYQPKRGDLMVTWNRIGAGQLAAQAFERHGLPVLVTENASWGSELAGKHWYTLARSYHNVAKMFPIGDHDRWDRLGVDLAPWRSGGETVILASRGIGPPEYRMPYGWAHRIAVDSVQGGPCRVRPHPGKKYARSRESNRGSLESDLSGAGKVITWGSGAAVKALMWGIPVESHMPDWIARQDNTDAGRLAAFRTLAWAQSTLDEIRSGEAFNRLLRGEA